MRIEGGFMRVLRTSVSTAAMLIATPALGQTASTEPGAPTLHRLAKSD